MGLVVDRVVFWDNLLIAILRMRKMCGLEKQSSERGKDKIIEAWRLVRLQIGVETHGKAVDECAKRIKQEDIPRTR